MTCLEFYLFLIHRYFKRYLLIYIWLCWIFVAAHGLSLVVGIRGYSLVVVCRLLTAMAFLAVEQGLKGTWSSVVVTHKLSCSEACGILVLDQGLNPCPLHWQMGSQPPGHQGSPFLEF